MAKIIAHLSLKDYKQWRNVFESMRPVRKNLGAIGDKIFKAEGNDKEVFVSIEWDTMEEAKKFRESQEIKDAMERAGILESTFFFSD